MTRFDDASVEVRALTELGPDLSESLRSLAVSYASGVDLRSVERLLSAFHPEGSLVVHRPSTEPSSDPAVLSGHEEILRVFDRLARYEATFHLLGQSSYRRDRDDISGEVYCVANHYLRADDGVRNEVMYIRYDDRYLQGTDGEWKIQRRDVRPLWKETHPIASRAE